MIGPHAQRGGAWINHVHKLPNGAPVKAVDDYQLLWQAYDINPTLYTVFRKFWDGQQTYDDAPFEVKKQRAKDYLGSFLDSTFDQNKHKVKAIGLWNEEYAASQTPQEKQRRIDQDRAFIIVWLEEYKSKYPHIHLHSTSAAPGNSIPLGIAALAHEFRNQVTYVLDYHAYTAVNNNAVVPGENVWCSGRWMQDDALYRQSGFFVKWFSGESGATGWNFGAAAKSTTPFRGWETPVMPEGITGKSQLVAGYFDYGGWKEPQVHNGNLQSYLDVTVDDNLSRWKAWNAANNGRFLGAVQFTSNNNADSRWQSYELLNEWGPMADYVRTHSGSTPPPPTYPNPLPNLKLGRPFADPYVLTSAFNDPRDYDGDGTYDDLHEGADYDIIGEPPESTKPVLCLYDGTVVHVQEKPGGYGKRVIVEHSHNGGQFFTWYGHLDAWYVQVGQAVKTGDEIGEIGDTGNASGEHVHVNLQVPHHGLPGYVIADVVDPAPYIGLAGEPTPPPTGDNQLVNGSFENGWTDTATGQTPNGWTLEFDEKPNTIDPLSPYVKFESQVKPKSQFPPAEQTLFFLDGDHVLKVFKGSGAWWGRFKQTLNVPNGRYVLSLPIYGDFVTGYTPSREKIFATYDPQNPAAHIRINGGNWVLMRPGMYETYEFELDVTNGDMLTIEIRANYRLPQNGIFCDKWELLPMAQPDINQSIWDASVEEQITRGVPLNPNAGLQKMIINHEPGQYTPVHRERTITVDGIDYGYMAGEDVLGNFPRLVWYFRKPWTGEGGVTVIDAP